MVIFGIIAVLTIISASILLAFNYNLTANILSIIGLISAIIMFGIQIFCEFKLYKRRHPHPH